MRTFLKQASSKAVGSVKNFISRKQLEEKLQQDTREIMRLREELESFKSQAAQRKRGIVAISKVVDGDTIHGDWNGIAEKFRFLNVDTPERGESLFHVATDALKALVHPGSVRIAFEEPHEIKRDNFGRLLVYVFNQKGQHVNVELLRAGLSPYVREYGDGRYRSAFLAAEAEAKAAQRGIWSPDYIRKKPKRDKR